MAFISRLSIRQQFTLLSITAVLLTLIAMGMALQRSYGLAMESKKSSLRNLVESATTAVSFFVEQDKNGTMTRAQAQKAALEMVEKIRFAGTNYFFITNHKYVTLYNFNKSLIGKDRTNDVDIYGNYISKTMVDYASSGHPDFNYYYWPRAGQTNPVAKIGYGLDVPEWGWVIGGGLYVDDIWAELWASAEKLAVVFVPLFASFLVLVFSMRRSVSNLLISLSSGMVRLARGDYGVNVEGSGRADELGKMAQAVQIFKDNGLKLQATEAEAARHRAEAEAERAGAEAARGVLQRQQQEVMNALASGLDHLAKGDLTSRLRDAFPADYEKLRADFNTTADSLLEAMRTIAAATAGINSGSDQIAQASDHLSRRTEQQAANLEETAAALNHLAETVNKTASGAGEAAKVAGEARASAEQSGDIVHQAVEAMGKIKDSATKITNIIGVIDEIAFQTNLLALNAGVEAARAGDAGRGFAVVASEVRSLAQRSAEAAKEIKSLIQASTSQVETGVALVDRTGTALRDIIGRVATMDGLVREISASSREQASGLAEINTAIGQMDQAVQQNAAMVEESTAAAHALRNESEDLTNMVGRFRTVG